MAQVTWRRENDRPVYNGDEFSGYRWWRDEWRAAGLESPLDLAAGAPQQRKHQS
jgi:hypothetical protein